MKREIETLSQSEIKDWLIHAREKYYIEMKKASELPSAFWESYSAFCNTEGGFIILGVAEGYPQNEITGVGNVQKTLTTLWDQVSNTQKISFRNIDNHDVHTISIDGKDIIIIRIKEAADNMKPIYVNGKFENTYVRTGDGDRKATKEELAAFFRNAQPVQDSLTADKFTLDDLDIDSVISFKERINKRYPNRKYLEMSNEKFLVEIGACKIDRETKEFRITRGALLFFGKVNSIRELYHHYHVDYFNRKGGNPRWSDRVSDDEPSEYEMNLFNFFTIVHGKLRSELSQNFRLGEDQMRIPLTDFDETIRECIVNCLAHADYVQGFPTIKIEAHDGWFSFLNPGKMLISREQFLLGGDSRPRNEIIMKFFRWLGASERQGYGGPLIFNTAIQNELRRPEIVTDIEHTELKVWNIDLVDSYPELDSEEKMILRFIAKSGEPESANSIKDKLGMTEYKVRKILPKLEEKKLICKTGNGSATRYSITVGSVEFVAKLQLALDSVKRQMV